MNGLCSATIRWHALQHGREETWNGQRGEDENPVAAFNTAVVPAPGGGRQLCVRADAAEMSTPPGQRRKRFCGDAIPGPRYGKPHGSAWPGGDRQARAMAHLRA